MTEECPYCKSKNVRVLKVKVLRKEIWLRTEVIFTREKWKCNDCKKKFYIEYK